MWTYAIGYSDLNTTVSGKAIDIEDRFLIYSLTKTFIAAAVLKLTEDGLVDLDAPFSTYLSDTPFGSEFTVRQALNHSSGLPDYGSLPEYNEAVKRPTAPPWSFNEFIERALHKGLAFDPGMGWGYSNIGYMLLSRVIERITKQELGTALSSLIFQPLGLEKTRVANSREEMQSLVAGNSLYLSSNGSTVDARSYYDPRWVAHGVIASTVSDVVTFYHQLLEGSLLSGPMMEAMLTLVSVHSEHPHFVTPSYGLGLMADPDSTYGRLYGHTGEGPGYCGAVYHLRTTNGHATTVGILCNSEGATYAEGVMMDLFGVLHIAKGD